jgi:SP family sugar:H+ symporter-like MFS transporter
VPEVKGLSLEEVDELYRANIKPWQSVGWKPAAHTSRHVRGRRVVNGEIVDDDDSDEVAEPQVEKAGDAEKQRVENA